MRKSRSILSINAGSIADIAFLLLVFFLVVTTIYTDQGIKVTLAPYEENNADIKSKDAILVFINSENKILIENIPVRVDEISDKIYQYLTTYYAKKQQPILALKNDRFTSYHSYIMLYNEIEKAYNQFWNEKALIHFGDSFKSLDQQSKNHIINNYPKNISESEYIVPL